jgi:hypothetical protein
VGESEGQNQLDKLDIDGLLMLKCITGCGLDSSGCGLGQLVDSCEQQ